MYGKNRCTMVGIGEWTKQQEHWYEIKSKDFSPLCIKENISTR